MIFSADPSLFERWRARFAHYGRKLATLTLGAVYVSDAAVRLRQRHDRRNPLPENAGRLAVVGHAFYAELAPELAACRAVLPASADLHLTVPRDRVESVEAQVRGGIRRTSIVPVENRGRDIAPFLRLLNAGALDPYDAVLKLHTKRSPHLRDGDLRRRLLFTVLAGSHRHAGRALKLFEDPTVGMVGWRAAWRRDPIYWMDNRAAMASLCARMGIALPAMPAFFEGSMFWVRPAALGRLRDLRLEAEDFEPEQGQLDGALHHAIERLFAPAVAAAGFSVRDLSGRVLLSKADVAVLR